MQSLLHILLSNAASAAVLAAVVWPLCLLCRRPALKRALWLVVLFKLLCPPLVALPLDRWITPHQAQHANVQLPPPPSNLEFTADPTPATVPRTPAPVDPKPRSIALKPRVLSLAPTVWIAGSLLLLLTGSIRIAMLLRLLSKAPLASDDIQALAASIAAR